MIAEFRGHIYLTKIGVMRRSHESGYPVDHHRAVKVPTLVHVSSANDDVAKEGTDAVRAD